MNAVVQTETATPILLDLGCGKNKKAGHIGIDQYQFDGVDAVADLTQKEWLLTANIGGICEKSDKLKIGFDGDLWRLPDSSVTEIHCSHFLEHLNNNPDKPERVRFMNELYRVLIPGGKATVITPHWASNRAYGDFTHCWPAVSEMFYYYVSKEWRMANAPHNDISVNPDGYNCDFSATWGYGLHPEIIPRNQQYQTFALTFYKEAAADLHATLVAVKK